MAHDQRRLLVAWALLEEQACRGDRSKSTTQALTERNDITHKLERSEITLQRALKNYPVFNECYTNVLEMPKLHSDALAFVRLLAILREDVFEKGHIGKDDKNTPALDDELRRLGFDMGHIAIALQERGLDLYKAKSMNRLRNAFISQTCKRLQIPKDQIWRIKRHLNEELERLNLEGATVDDFVEVVQGCHAKCGVVTRRVLEEDYRKDTGKDFKECDPSDLNLGSFLHILHSCWFKARGDPRRVGSKEIIGNAQTVAGLCGGVLLTLHKAVLANGDADLIHLPDIGQIIEESLATLSSNVKS